MSTIQKISRAKGIVYRVLIRKSGMKAITKTFPTKKEAVQFSQKIEGNIREQIAFTSLDNKLTFKELAGDYLVKECYVKQPKERARAIYRASYMAKSRGKGVRPAQTKDFYCSRLKLKKRV
jgi:hypothetical protein